MRRVAGLLGTTVAVAVWLLLAYLTFGIIWGIAAANDDVRGYATAAILTSGFLGVIAVILVRSHRRGELVHTVRVVAVTSGALLLVVLVPLAMATLVM